MTGSIYQATCSINGKIYVGQTTRSFSERVAEHLRIAGKDTAFHRAIRKYGRDAFSWVVLEECTTEEDLNAAEKKWIRLKASDSRSVGYNRTPGGEVIGKKTRAQIERGAEKLRGRKLSAEHIEKARAGLIAFNRLHPRPKKEKVPKPRHPLSSDKRAALKEKLRNAALARFSDPVERKRQSEINRSIWARPGYRESRLAPLPALPSPSPRTAILLSQRMLRYWIEEAYDARFLKKDGTRGHLVIHLDTGFVFSNVSAASRACGCGQYAINRHIAGNGSWAVFNSGNADQVQKFIRGQFSLARFHVLNDGDSLDAA